MLSRIATLAILPMSVATALSPAAAPSGGDLSKIRHIVILMQENRSFDHYFGTFPGADGIPRDARGFTVCVPDPATRKCVKPFHDPKDSNGGGPHGEGAAHEDINQGEMNGFIAQARSHGFDPSEIMGYHDQRELPNYWAYAKRYVLQDRMFASEASYSLPSHLYLVSAWSARCATPGAADSCTSDLASPDPEDDTRPIGPDYAWTDITYLLHRHHVSWRFYSGQPTPADCDDTEPIDCGPGGLPHDAPGGSEYWNPLPDFSTVHDDGELGNVQPLPQFYKALSAGALASVTWITPRGRESEHPTATVSAGQNFVTGVVNAIMKSPLWASTAIFITWDEWGGFYDHVVPPVVDRLGYGLRVPGLMISPYARRGYIDHQTLSFDAYLKFIEDRFLDGVRLDPRRDGRRDPRPTVREEAPVLGDLAKEFDFTQRPQPAVLLPLVPESQQSAPLKLDLSSGEEQEATGP